MTTPIANDWLSSIRFALRIFSLFLLLQNFLSAQEPIRTWTSSDGRTLEARFVEKVGSSSVKVENAAGKEFTLPKSRISAADWKYVEKKVAELKVFRLPESLSGKGCVIIASLNGNIEVFDNPSEEGFFGGSYINGNYVEPKKAKGRKPLVGDIIQVGGVIITGAKSEVVLLLTNGTIATLNENSRVVLENLWQTPFKASSKKVTDLNEEPSVSRTSMELDFGELIVDVKKLNKSSSFLVRSPLGVAGIRGTQFRYSAKDNGTTLSVTEGLVEYLDPKRKIFKVGKENSVTTQADESSKQGKLNENERSRIKSVISKASQSSVSFDLKKLSDASEKSSQQKKIFIARSAKNLEMIWCPPGSYLWGRSIRSSNTVILTKGFYLGKYEVTQEQYQSVAGDNPSSFQGAKLPVEKVHWEEAMAFCKKLSEKEKGRIPVGWEFTLPTEAQWEYACRAGTTTKYSWGDDINSKLANYLDSGLRKTRAVGSYRPNAWGFFDMHGNVRERTLDWFATYPRGLFTDPAATTSGPHGARGGGFLSSGERLCSAKFDSGTPGSYGCGFRVVFQKK